MFRTHLRLREAMKRIERLETDTENLRREVQRLNANKAPRPKPRLRVDLSKMVAGVAATPQGSWYDATEYAEKYSTNHSGAQSMRNFLIKAGHQRESIQISERGGRVMIGGLAGVTPRRVPTRAKAAT